MTVETYNANPEELINSILVSDAAIAHFRKQLTQKSKCGVRISLKESGCTGFKYVIEEVDGSQPNDVQKELAEGITLFVEPSSLAALKGLEIDYTQEGVNKNLVMNNPNVKDACGCGESFSV